MAWQVEWLILWKMIVKMLTYNTWWCTLGGVGTFTKEMKLELMWINSAMKRRREGLDTPPAECSPVECGQSDGATGALDRKDRGHCK